MQSISSNPALEKDKREATKEMKYGMME